MRGRGSLAGGACRPRSTLASSRAGGPVRVPWGGGGGWGKNGVVLSGEGKSYEGDVAEKGDNVVVTVKGGIPVTLQKDTVDTIEYADNTAAQFKQRLAKLDEKDSKGHVELARWAIDRREYSLAQDALDGALDADKNNEE